MDYIRGVTRNQVILFPETVEDYITEDNPVRFIDAFVSSLDLGELGFMRAQPAETGRPAYDPSDLLRLYLYGYLNRVRSSRMLERETKVNLEVMWLLGKLRPDFKTIADFRRDNLKAIKQVCREFTLLCRKLKLFGGELVAIDGSDRAESEVSSFARRVESEWRETGVADGRRRAFDGDASWLDRSWLQRADGRR